MRWRVPGLGITAALLAVSVLVGGLMVIVFGDIRIQSNTTYKAAFDPSDHAGDDVSGMLPNSDVRAAGVPVGKVKKIHLDPTTRVVTVTFTVEKSITLLQGSTATVRYKDLVGNRYLEIGQGPGTDAPLRPGATIPAPQTQGALDLDSLYNSFQPLFTALTPTQVNQITASIISVFQGESGTIDDLLGQVGSFTSTLGDDDQVIGELIGNLDSVLANVNAHASQTSDVILRLQQLVSGLAQQRVQIVGSFGKLNTLTETVTSLLDQARPPLAGVVTQLTTVAANINKDKAELDTELDLLPYAYRVLNRQGAYGSTFNFYLCGVQIITDASASTAATSSSPEVLTSTVNAISDQDRCQTNPADLPTVPSP